MGQGDEGLIYRVSIPIPNSTSTLLQTGFRLRGQRGIITALHGVAVGGTCSAYNSGAVYNNLQITKLNVDQDVVLLSSPELETNDVGFIVGEVDNVKDGDNLRAYGYPNGADLYNKPVSAATPHLRVLNDLLDDSTKIKISGRRSPNQTIGVLALDGPLGPGYSGGPVLNSQDEVVAVVDGGITAFGNDWSIPLKSIVWCDAESYQGALDVLKSSGIQEGLFSTCYNLNQHLLPAHSVNSIASALPDPQRASFLLNSPVTDNLLNKFSGQKGDQGSSGDRGHDGRRTYLRSGKNGSKGSDGVSGLDGEIGQPGADASSIKVLVDLVEFETLPPLLKIQINSSDGQETVYLETNLFITFNLSGGSGGNGGNGGNGGRGGAGGNGGDGSSVMMVQPAIAFNGGDGGAGGDGGSGGNGGDGGRGGNGGHVLLVWGRPDLADQFSASIRFNTAAGEGGVGGLGGSGGKGGDGGASGHGTIYYNGYTQAQGTDGDNGDSGQDGNPGLQGNRGALGSDGKISVD